MSFDAGGRVHVPITINGQTVNMLLSTGSPVSLLTWPTVEALGLTPKSGLRELAKTFGGRALNDYAVARDIRIGRVQAEKLTFLIAPGERYAPEEGGVIGADIIRGYDADFDFGNGAFTLFSHDYCEGSVVYWTKGSYARVPFRIDENGRIRLTVLLDGKEVTAVVETLAPTSVARLERIETDLDIDAQSPGLKPIAGSGRERTAYRYPFKTMTFGAVSVNNPDIVLVPDDVSKLTPFYPTIILGMNILRKLHLYIAYGENAIYVTPATAH